MDIFQSCKDMLFFRVVPQTCDKTRGSEVCEGMSGCRERMRRMKTRCAEGDMLGHTGWRHHRGHGIIKRHAPVLGSSRRHGTRRAGVRCVSVRVRVGRECGG